MERKDKKKNSGLGIVTVIGMAVLGMMADAGSIASLVVLLVILAAIAGIAVAVKKAKKPGTQAARHRKIFPTDEDIARRNAQRRATGRHQVQQRAYDPQAIRDRDALRRFEQLDSFLKNGLIDRAEYRVLVERYKKESGLS